MPTGHQEGATSTVQEAANTYCQQLVPYIEDAALLLLGSQQSCDTNVFMAAYLSAVISGQHVLWRHYAYVAATPHNRKVFLACARRCLAPTAQAGRLSLGDVQSLLLLLCPDFPLATVKNAWSPAVAIQTWQDQSKQGQQLQPVDMSAAVPSVHLPVFLQCFDITFIYEKYLLELRRNAFTDDKKCMSLEHLDGVMASAGQQLPTHGWPVPKSDHMRRAVMQASRARTYPDFAFGELVKALCCSQEVVLHVRQQLLTATAAAAAAAAANSRVPGAERSTGSSDDSFDDDGAAMAAMTAAYKQQQAARSNMAGASSATNSAKPWR